MATGSVRHLPRQSVLIRPALIVLLALLAAPGLQPGTTQLARAATTITVTTMADELNSDGDCALREAIRAANLDQAVDACPAGSGADTVTIPAGTYTLTVAGDEDNGLAGDLDLTGVVTLAGAGASMTIIDGNALDRVVDVRSGASVTMSDVTIRNGQVTGARNGGGIANLGILQLTESRVTGNYGSDFVIFVENGGGGIFNAGTLQVTASSVDHNSSGDEGGGIYNVGTLEITDSHFDSNVAGFGAGIWSTGTVTLLRSTVNDNAASIDAGIVNHGPLTISESSVSRNHASFLGAGGISSHGILTITQSTISSNVTDGGRGGGIANFHQLTIANSTISGNTATATSFEELVGGGGIYTEQAFADQGLLAISNSTISGNRSHKHGGGIAAVDGEPGCCTPNLVKLSNVTMTGNIADSENDGVGAGGGVFNQGSTVELHNTIVAGNSDSDGQTPDCVGPLASQGYNLIGDGTGCTIGGTTTGNLVGVDPLLGPLQDNGGPTATHLLLLGSPAIDAGNPAAPGSGDAACEATDQRGITRPQDGDGDGTERCDIGAVELEPTTSVISVDIDIKPGSVANPINLTSKGVIPVAILSTEGFDATTVFPSSVCFGDAEEPSQRDCSEKHGTGHYEDVNGDGRLDLLLHYETQQTGIDPGDTEACLTGEATAGVRVAGCDTIRVR